MLHLYKPVKPSFSQNKVNTPGRRQLKTNVDQKSIETVFLIAICCQWGDKWQLKTLFLLIFDLRSSIVLAFSIAAYAVWLRSLSSSFASSSLDLTVATSSWLLLDIADLSDHGPVVSQQVHLDLWPSFTCMELEFEKIMCNGQYAFFR